MGATGAPVPRWRLGTELKRYREQAKLTPAQVAGELEYSESKIRKIEAGRVPVKPADLTALAALYGIAAADQARLEAYRRMGSQRGWWSTYPLVTHEHAMFFGMESSARTIRSWQPFVVHGLLQTEGYVHALARGWGYDDQRAAELATVRMERQKLIFESESMLRVVLDEGVLHRTFGDPAMLHEQLAALLDPPPSCLIQVLPHNADAHRATTGDITVYEFDGDLHSPIATSETALGILYVEDDEVAVANNTVSGLMAVALSPRESAKMIRARMRAIRGRK